MNPLTNDGFRRAGIDRDADPSDPESRVMDTNVSQNIKEYMRMQKQKSSALIEDGDVELAVVEKQEHYITTVVWFEFAEVVSTNLDPSVLASIPETGKAYMQVMSLSTMPIVQHGVGISVSGFHQHPHHGSCRMLTPWHQDQFEAHPAFDLYYTGQVNWPGDPRCHCSDAIVGMGPLFDYTVVDGQLSMQFPGNQVAIEIWLKTASNE
jgi:hypothetical protein